MEDVGERLVGDYLRFILKCDFIDFNVYTEKVQGEIDVIGINNKAKHVYICEVVTHLATGMQYTNRSAKGRRPDTAERLVRKFIKGIEYGEALFDGYEKSYMFWSPVVKPSKGKDEYNQMLLLEKAVIEIETTTGIKIKKVINEDYVNAIEKLRQEASKKTEELKSPIMRFLQIEYYARNNLKRLNKSAPNRQSNSS